MICLEFNVNGKPGIIAGEPNATVIAASIAIYPEIHETILKVTGQVAPPGQPEADARWFAGNLAVGDVVSIRVIESDNAAAATLTRDDPSITSSDDIPLSCSFCGKAQSAVEHLTAGKRAMICNECIESLHQSEILDRKQEQMLDATDDA